MSTNVLVAAVAFGATIPLTWAAVAIGQRVKLLDVPTAIKPHARPVPFLGGAPISAVAVVAAVVTGFPALAGATAILWAIGFIDDVRSLSPRMKLVLELLPLLLVAGTLDQPTGTMAFAVVVGLVLVNVFNVIDGLDGLAAGCALPPLSVLMTADGAAGHLAAVAAGSVLAFLVFNWPPAKIFLGDQGSLVLGFLLWALPLMASVQLVDWTGAALWLQLWIFPLVNAAYVIAFRVRAHRPIMRGDRSHLYDEIHRRFGLARTLIACWSVAVIGAVAALVAGQR